MRFCFKFSERKLTIAGSTVLCLLGFGHEALAQTAQPKGQAAPVNAPADAAGQPSQPQPNWIVSCNQTRPGLECRAGQSLFLKRTRQRVLSVAVRMPADTKKPNFLMQLPLGVYLPAGATLQIGKEEVKTLPYIAVRAAGGDAQRRSRRNARADGDVGIAVATERAMSRHAVPQRAGDRLLDHAEHGHAVLDQRDVDGELAVALDELAGAVQRVDQPEPRPLPARGDVRALDSSDSTGMSGVSSANPATMQRWAARSAAVSGERSSLCCTANSLS